MDSEITYTYEPDTAKSDEQNCVFCKHWKTREYVEHGHFYIVRKLDSRCMSEDIRAKKDETFGIRCPVFLRK